MLTLGLVNTYDKIKILDAHYRSIARAAPIAYSYGFALALFDYPFKMNAEELCDFVADKTTIGRSGKYLLEMLEHNRFFVFDLPKKGFQAQFGVPVVTTSSPDPKKAITPVALADEINRGGSYLLLVGLGRKGLPRELFERAVYHLDITGMGIPLETCTAIGAVPAVLAALVGKKE
ncbi:MAG: DUF531 domain-containing protein [ANME-2 cluster archaeon]|nr:DUF531 domain-containing protein [ANME-2 cluster archaeon]MDF1556980.1 DUF531 domain-containing protein [ANME-2 cluster archaeon]